MKNLERILWSVVVAALLMKVAHLPLSSFLLILGLNLLAIIYFCLSWLVFPAPARNDQSIPLSLVAGLVISVASIGILFKLQLWPLSGFFLAFAAIGLALLAVAVAMVWSARPALSAYTRGLLFRIVPLLIVCTALYLLPGGRLTAFYYRDRPDIAPLMIQRNASTDPVERERLTIQIDSIEQARMMKEYNGAR